MADKVISLSWADRIPEQVTLARGEFPDMRAYPVRAKFDDGSSKILVITDGEALGLKPYRRGEQTAVYTYGGCSLAFPVYYMGYKLSNVTLKTPGKTIYEVGEPIDASGFIALAEYSDGTDKEVRLVCHETAQPGMTSVTMNYGCRTLKIPITVNEPHEAPTEKQSEPEPVESETKKTVTVETPQQPPQEQSAGKHIVAISVSHAPIKTKYRLGRVNIDLTGGVLDVMYDDGGVRQIAMSNDSMTAEPKSYDIGDTDVVVTAFGRTATYPISIVESRAVRVTVKKAPEKLEYEDGEFIDLSGLVLSVLYNDESVEDVSGLNVQYELRKGEDVVSLNYMGIPFDVPVVVRRRQHKVYPMSLSLSKLPDKTTYIQGEREFDPTGGMLLLQMSDGIRKEIPFSEAEITGFNTSHPGEVSMTAKVDDFSYNFTIRVTNCSVIGISIEGTPKTRYYEGDDYSMEGLIVYASYDNGAKKAISNYRVDKRIAKLGDSTLIFTYEGKMAELPVEVVKDRVVDLKVSNPPKRVNYYYGDPIVCDGGRLRATYESGRTESVVLESEFIVGYNSKRLGKQVVQLMYGGRTASFEIYIGMPAVTGIEITAYPKVTYKEGETFDEEGLAVSAVLQNGQHRPLERKEYEVLIDRPLAVTDTFVLVSYAGGLVAAVPVQVAPDPNKPLSPVPVESEQLTKEVEPEAPVEPEPIAEAPVEKTPMEQKQNAVALTLLREKNEFKPFYPSTVGVRFVNNLED